MELEFKTLVNKISCCHCGSQENNHRFRHTFENHHTVEHHIDKDGKDFFVLNAADFDVKTEEGDCQVPQCSAGKPLHGVLIPHEFKPLITTYREILFKLPIDTKCRSYSCKGTVGSHPYRHMFSTYVNIVGLEDSDKVIIKCGQQELSQASWSNNNHSSHSSCNDKETAAFLKNEDENRAGNFVLF